jgi:DNA-binding CsgD family transcriptional regulator/CheY-like chemotaxis protein
MHDGHEPALPPAAPPEAESSMVIAGAGLRVALIEGDRTYAQTIKSALGGFAVDCVLAETMASARGLLRADAGDFDAFLLDLNLPDGRGEDLLPELEALPKQPGIVIFSDCLLEARPEAISYRAILTSKLVAPSLLVSLLHVASRGYAECTLARFARDHGLTAKEHDVLQRIARGDSPKRVALELGCSLQAVYAHLARIGRKTGCDSYHETIAKLFQFSCHGLGHRRQVTG